MSPRTITLTAGVSKAEISLTGAALTGLSLGGKVLISGVGENTQTFFGSLLAPWPNRIKGAKYLFDGKTLELDAGDGLGNALHGLVFDQTAEVLEQSESSVKLGVSVPQTRGYPFQISIEVDFFIQEDQLSVALVAKNIGKQMALLGLGYHPYFVVNDQTKVEIKAQQAYVHDIHKIPVTAIDAKQLGLGPGSSKVVSDLDLDTQFSNLDATAATLTYGDEAFDLWVAGGDYLMVYTPKDFPWKSGSAPAIAIEPQTCAVDAFNSSQEALQLASGDVKKLAWGIRRVR